MTERKEAKSKAQDATRDAGSIKAQEISGKAAGLRQQADEALRESESLYRESFESSSDALFLIETDTGQIIDANYMASEIYGYSRDEFLIRKSTDLSAEPEKTERRIQESQEKPGQVFKIPLRLHRKKDGTVFPVDITARAFVRKGKTVLFVSSRDITERMQAEDSLRQSEERHRVILHTAMDGFWMTDMQNRLLEVNEAYCQMSGYSAQELLAMPLSALDVNVTTEDLSTLREITMTQGEKRFESSHRRKDGSIFDVEVSVQYLPIEGGRFISFLRDITERKRAYAALRASEQRYREFFEHEPNYCYRVSPNGAILDLNPSALHALGYPSKDDIVGKPLLTTIYAPASRDKARQLFLRWKETGKVENEELSIITKTGEERVIILNASAVRDTEKRILNSLSIQTDITERKRAEEEKNKLEAKLQQAQKLETIGRLAGGVAHDFNNMLGVIIGNAEMALEKVDPALPLYDELSEIHKAALRSADTTRQLLTFARKQMVSPKVLDLNETITGMLRMLQRLIGEDIYLKWQPDADLWPVWVDSSQIDQILANLCVNARDAITDVGKITIETGNITFDEDYCANHPGFSPGKYAMITVSDDGSGMDKETLAHIFEPFFTTKGVGEGTGLGLAMVYGAVKQNNGFINVYSELGQGTRFTIYLPRYMTKAEKAQVEGVPEDIRRGLETILLVEDELSILKMIKMMLQKQGYTVLSANTPGEAINLAREHAGEIHLLMTDVVMPEMNGRDLAKNLLSLYPSLKRLFMSGYTSAAIVHRGMVDEGVYLIQKPFTIKELTDKVRKVLDSE